MVDYIDTPLAYIMGMKRELWNNRSIQKKIVSNEVIVFDIDHKQFNKSLTFPFNAELFKEELNEDLIGKEMRIKSGLLKMYSELVGDVSKYGDSFKVEEYLKSVKNYSFMKEFVKTNLFIEKISSSIESSFETINDHKILSQKAKKIKDAIRNVIVILTLANSPFVE
jgi:hypothetical protein